MSRLSAPPGPSLAQQARSLKAAGRVAEALAMNRRAVAEAPASGVAEHNLAATLGDLGRFAEAEAAARRAQAKGVDAPETWLVLGRALQGLCALGQAEQAFMAAVARRPLYVDAHRDLAQLRWMRTSDADAALVTLDAALAAAPQTAELVLLKARVLDCAGRAGEAGSVLERALLALPSNPALRLAAARLAAHRGEADTQLRHGEAALRAAPGEPEAATGVIEALLHSGRAGEADALAERLERLLPGDQGVLALRATAWRMLGDPRHAALCEDPAFVSGRVIATPVGWPSLSAFLAELAETLRARHPWRTHPLDQSLRGGSQTQEDLSQADAPSLRALFPAIAALVADHVAGLGRGNDRLRARGGSVWRLGPAWSVLLRPGGFHTDHVHPQGWLSAAFYVALPEAVGRGREGWLAFGRPGVATRPVLPPFRWLRPEPGLLALFPSYLWHGTEPFAGEEDRLTVAFDVLPGG